VRAVVVGGGIAGLAAAHDLTRYGARVTVCEAGERLGGKVRTEDFAGRALDLGADSVLARRPEAVALCRELGLGDELVAPATGTAYLWSRGQLRRLPPGLVLGVPTRLGALARSQVLSPLGLARAAIEPLLPGRSLAGDEALGRLVRRRLGGEVHDRLVAPLLGGINAGDIDGLSIEVVAPSVAAAARSQRSVVLGALAASTNVADPAAPVFLTLPGGLGRMVDAVVEHLVGSGSEVRTDEPVTELERRDGAGYVVRTRSVPIAADAVVVAAPAPVAARLLAPHAPIAAAVLAGIEYASVALVALAFPAAAIPCPLDGSGFLVARGEGRLVTACSWSSSKWAHLAGDGTVVLRVSAGRAGDERAAALDDDALISRIRLELGLALGIKAPPSEVRVARWQGAFPQHAPGHLDRMAAAHAEVARRLPGVALAGAAVAGVGIPACIASGQEAAVRVIGARAS
jgi:oxygen-dependent protoporphyrinogen oxidase